jgi:serpin B
MSTRHFLRTLLLLLIQALLLGGAPYVRAVESAAFTTRVNGVTESLNLTARLAVAAADRDQQGNVYLAARWGPHWVFHDGTQWQTWLGGAWPAYARGPLQDREIAVLEHFDASALIGAEIYLGYGQNETDLLQHAQYGLLHTFEEITQARSSLPRTANTAPDGALQNQLVNGNTDFALALYRQLLLETPGEENLLFSPLSISTALAMTYAGARGQTATEMVDALRFSLPAEPLHAGMGWLDRQLSQRGAGAQGKDEQPFRLVVSNSVWGDGQASFVPDYLDILAQYYGTGISLLDFQGAPDSSRIKINDWVAERTEQRIQNLLPESTVTTATRLVLVNAVYFNAAWQKKFDVAATTEELFKQLDGSSKTVSLMNQTSTLNYTAGEGYQAVELPYDGGELVMLVILPADGRMAEIEQSLNAESLQTMRNAMQAQYTQLALPRFKLDGSFGLKSSLQQLGMRQAFTDQANFSAISSGMALFVQDVVHKSFAEVDENGTEAAAATGVIAGVTAIPPKPVVFKANRPFLFAIIDQPTAALVFLGRIVDPRQ